MDLDNLRRELEEYRQHLIGITIYYQLIPKALRWTNKGPFNRIKGRLEVAIQQADQIILKTEAGEDLSTIESSHSWPEKWTPMEQRAKTSYEAYIVNKNFIKSPFDQLSKSDIKLIRQTVSAML